jgi:hypothetical protein
LIQEISCSFFPNDLTFTFFPSSKKQALLVFIKHSSEVHNKKKFSRDFSHKKSYSFLEKKSIISGLLSFICSISIQIFLSEIAKKIHSQVYEVDTYCH